MKKLFVIALSLFVVGYYGSTQVTAKQSCEQVSVPPVCQRASRITINNNSHSVSPPNICVSPGEAIEVNVTPDGTASIEGKSGGWPNGSGSSFTITAPGPGDYDYNVYFDDGTCLDPRISVGD